MANKTYLDKNGLTYFWGKIKTSLTGKQDTLVSGTNIKTINNNSLLGSGDIAVGDVPVGTIMMWPADTPPNNWLLCDGTAYSKTTFSVLYDVIGTTYGNNGTDYFKVPDLEGRVPVGKKLGDTDFDTLGKKGGSKEMQAHNHGGSTSTNYAYDTSRIYTSGGGENLYAINWGGNRVGSDNTYRERTNHSHTINTDGTGNSGNLQPYIVLNYIIKYQ